ncbi:MAG: hypothetical protein HRU15_09435, partial [Planctomycetes bacterium]|nr:hypothetical protein [Planctomycetota bacterium]
NGIAEKVAVTQQKKAQDQPSKERQAMRREEMTQTLTKREGQSRLSRKKKVEDEKKTMRMSLRMAADAALESVNPEKESVASADPAKKSPGTESVSKEFNVTLGSEYRNKNSLITIPKVIVGAIIIAGAYFAFSGTVSPERAALIEFSQPVSSENIKYPKRMIAYLDRCWLTTEDGIQRPLVVRNIDQAIMQENMTIDFAEMGNVLQDILKDRRIYMDYAFAAMPHAEDQLGKYKLEYRGLEDGRFGNFNNFLLSRDFQFISFSDILRKLREKNISEEGVEVISLLLAGTQGLKGGNRYRENFAQGNFPEMIELVSFSGIDGMVLRDQGSEYEIQKVPTYKGYLLRFVGEGWDEGWKILTVYGRFHTNPLQRIQDRVTR